MDTPEHYRSLDPTADWALFDSDLCAPLEARIDIRPLELASAKDFWRSHISGSPSARHPMLLPIDHWLKASVMGPDWVAEFNESSEACDRSRNSVARFLREHFSLSENEPVYFVANCNRAYCAPWRLALSCWPCLLAMDNEGSFFFHPSSGRFAVFGPNGSLGFGTTLPPPPSAA